MKSLYGIQIIIIILSIPLIFEKIGPNHIYGFRTGKTLSDEKIWYKANKFGGWTMLIAGFVGTIYLLLLQLCKKYFIQTLRVESWGYLIIIPILLSVVVSLIYTARIPEGDEKPTEKKKFMESFMTSFAVTVYVFLCFIMILFTAPMAFNKIEPNSTYGFRTSKTLSSEENWYKANQFSGWASIIGSCITLVCLLFLKLLTKTSSRCNNGLVYLMVYLCPLSISFFVSFLYLLKL